MVISNPRESPFTKGGKEGDFVVFLGLGSNIGQRKKNIVRAIRLLTSNPNLRLLKLSSLYETSPVGPKQRKFINAAVKINTRLEPNELLKYLKKIEIKMGRKKNMRWCPRIIDIDILLYGKKILNGSTLKIPHPQMKNRLFVLEPLSEISPHLVHASLKTKIKELRDIVLLTSPQQKVKIIDKIMKLKTLKKSFGVIPAKAGIYDFRR